MVKDWIQCISQRTSIGDSTMKMEIHKFCYGCNGYKKMNSIYIDGELAHFECDECERRNEVGQR